MRSAGEPRPPPPLAEDAHKGDAGRALCVVGSRTMPGAAVLVARAAQRAGAGLVVVACLDPALLAIVPAAAPEAILIEPEAEDLRAGGAPSSRRATATRASPARGSATTRALASSCAACSRATSPGRWSSTPTRSTRSTASPSACATRAGRS
jgi:NAD(P)H-hydrate repair Nnr-like enzyme with NAD(P)H-hydrate dehydratase domain